MPTLREQIIPLRKLLLITSEMLIITAILFLGTSLPPLQSQPFDIDFSSAQTLRGLLSCVTIAILCQACLSYNDLYDWKVSQNRHDLPNRLLHAAGYALVMMAILVFLVPALFRFPGLANINSETWKLILLLALVFLAVYLFRIGFHWFFYKWAFGERLLIIGTGKEAREIAQLVVDNPMSGFECVGFITQDPAKVEAKPKSNGRGRPAPRVLGTVAQLPTLARQERIARVIVALEDRRGLLPTPQLLDCRLAGIYVEEREPMYERVAGKMAVESMRPSYLIFNPGFSKPPLTVAMKRILDLCASTVGLLLSAPVMVITAIAIKMDSKGPILFRQERVGQDGRIFRIMKFRTMREDAEKMTGPVWATDNDPRITRVGNFLRKTRIDEIPQVFNVFAGHMSFVGPRPEREHFVEELAEEIPFYKSRLTVKPGITGWAQVNMPYAASIEDTMEKLRFDLYYIKNLSLLFDLNILLRTVGVILHGKGR